MKETERDLVFAVIIGDGNGDGGTGGADISRHRFDARWDELERIGDKSIGICPILHLIFIIITVAAADVLAFLHNI